MSLADKIDGATNGLIAGAVAATVGAGSWLVRRVLTNEKQIAILEADLKRRDEQRSEDRQDVKDVKSDIRYIKEYLMEGKR